MQFGLVGKSLSHSFSKTYFEKKFSELERTDCRYNNYELNRIEEITSLLNLPDIKGLNVTIPYKETVIPFLDSVSPEAKQIGAVNCIVCREGKSVGHNTDAYGFSQSIKPFLDRNHERALILGTGGASKAVAYVLEKLGIPFYYVSREKKPAIQNSFTYQDLNEYIINSFKLIVNTTPLGMHPHVTDVPPLPFEALGPLHLVYDLIYNPAETVLLKKAREQSAITVNGLSMLQLQAEKSWELWTNN